MIRGYATQRSGFARHHPYLPVLTNYLKKRILVQDRGGGEFLTGGIRRYVEDIKFAPNKDIGPKDFFEIA